MAPENVSRLTVSVYVTGPQHLSDQDTDALGETLLAAAEGFLAGRRLPNRAITHSAEANPNTERWLSHIPPRAKRAAKAVLFALASLLPSPVAAQEIPSLKLETALYAAAATADVWSTVDCHAVGCVEKNPTIAWLKPHVGTAGMLAVGSAFDAGAIWLVHKWVKPRHPKLARVGLIVAAAVRGSIAARNWSQARNQRASNALREALPAAQATATITWDK